MKYTVNSISDIKQTPQTNGTKSTLDFVPFDEEPNGRCASVFDRGS
jgi:hypothetical protein